MGEQASRTNLVLVTYAFPPFAGVGVLRALSLARYLPSEGIDVTVVTAGNPASVGRDYDLAKLVDERVRIVRTFTPDLPFGFRKWLKKVLSRGPKQPPFTPAPAAAGKPSLLKRMLSPDPQVFWVPFARRAIRREMRRQRIDCVLITVPPFSALKLASQLRRGNPRLKLVLDFRDEWLASYFDRNSFDRSSYARARAFEIEAAAVNAADAVIMATSAAVTSIRARHPEVNPDKFGYVRNGFDPERAVVSSPEPRQDGPTKIVYVGTVYKSADPGALISALAALPQETRDRLQLTFIGHVEDPEARQELERLAPTVQLRGFLPQLEALKTLASADFALLLWNDPINVAAKFYDYLGSGRPLLALVDPGSEVADLIRETQSGWMAPVSDPAKIAELLHRAAHERASMISEFQPRPEVIAEFRRQTLAQRYAERLRQLTSRA